MDSARERPACGNGSGKQLNKKCLMETSLLIVFYPDALEKTDKGSAATAVTLAFLIMMAFQMLVLAH